MKPFNSHPVSRLSGARRVASLAVLTLAATAALSGCATTEKAGQAAVVGATTFAVSTIDAAVIDVNNTLASAGAPATDGAKAAVDNVQRLIQGELLNVAGQREGIVVTEGEVDKLINQAETQVNPQTGEPLGAEGLELALAQQSNTPSNAVQEAARSNVVQNKLVTKLGAGDQQAGVAKLTALLVALSKELKTSVAPRFGVWEDDKLQINTTNDSLSTPASSDSSAAPTPEGSTAP